MNGRRILSSCLAIALLLCGCSARAQKSAPVEPWSEGFWVWNLPRAAVRQQPVDVLYVQPFGKDWRPPQAREYWATFRYEQRGIPGDAFVAKVLSGLSEFPARTRGVQLDIDSPTGSLREYATFLKKVRAALPAGQELSITALLDWFRDGTDVGAAIEQVDEFVPQFYDVGDATRGEGIAMRVDAEQWGPRFQKFGKRFRIGISTFGRGRLPYSQKLYRVITPLDIANDPGYRLSTATNEAGELILNYDAAKGGERVQFIVPTLEGVRASVESARKMGAAGVLYFRWPNDEEGLVMSPDEVFGRPGRAVEVQARRGDCVAVACYDLTLVNATKAARETEYRIRSSVDLDYAIPNGSPARMVSARELSLKIPPHAAQSRIELGRVVAAQTANFAVEVR